MAKGKTLRAQKRQPTSSCQPFDHTSDYARRVLDGEIIAGKFVRLACERHFADLRDGADRGLYFDIAAADRAVRFFPAMFTIADDPDEKPFVLLDWQKFVVGSLFGWHRDGRLRFREVFVETGKGQAKSPLMGGIGLYVAGFMGLPRAECYYFAHKLDQAKVPFQDAANLARGLTPGYEDEPSARSMDARDEVFISGAGKNAWRIEFRATGSYLEAKATTDSLSGPRPDAAFADEVHEFNSSKALTLWKAGVNKKRGSAFLFMATNTPGADQAVCNEVSERYQHILEGHVIDDTSFGYIARVDDEDDPFTDESCWVKALPALGVTFDAQNVRDQVKQAETDASARLTVSRLYFGIPIGTSDFWVDQASWRACFGEVPEVPKGKCFLGLDLSDRNDLTALSAVWKNEADDSLKSRVWYWTTAQGIDRRSALDRIDYRQYVSRGELEIVDKPAIDYRLVADRIKKLMAEHDIEALAIDPNFNLSRFISDCEEAELKVWLYDGEDKPAGEGLKIVRHEQGGTVPFGGRKLCMVHSVERFKDKVLKGEIVIENSNLTAYCAANTGTALNKSNQPYFVKARQMGRIDGMVALAMAVGASEGVKQAPPKEYKMLIF